MLIIGLRISAQEASKVKVQDTRAIVPLPIDYNKEVRFEFKMRSAVSVPGSGYYSGLFTIAPWSDNSGGKHHQLNFNNGGLFYRSGYPESSSWENWKQLLMVDENNNVGVRTSSPMYPLDVNGIVRATEIKVQAQTADFVFEEDYDLKSLEEVGQFIKQNKHLPDIPSAKQMEEEGIGLAEMNKLLLQKVEELTLYIIKQDQRIQELEKSNQ